MTSQGRHPDVSRAIKQRNLFQAEVALREMGTPSLLVALDYLDLLAEAKPERAPAAALQWHGRLELETRRLSPAESQLARAALASLCAGDKDAIDVLGRPG